MQTFKKTISYPIMLLGISFIFLIFPAQAKAAPSASLYIAPASGNYVVGNTFNVGLYINSPSEPMNVAQGRLVFDKNLLEVININYTGAKLTLWTTEPRYSNASGVLDFAGGLPNPGYKGSSGLISNVTFKAKREGTAKIYFSSATVLANDGKGTNITKGSSGGTYIISSKPIPPKEEMGALSAEIKSTTHPDQNKWYADNLVELSWNLPAGTKGVNYILDKNPNTIPDSKSQGLPNLKKYENVENGKWYFHLRLRDKTGWGPTTNYKISIDFTPPKQFEPQRETATSTGENISFQTIDDLSGLREYEIYVDNFNNRQVVLAQNLNEIKKFIPQNLQAGKHTVLIKATDNAGNDRFALVDFNIPPLEAPVILNYSQNLKQDQEFYISGSGPKNSKITIFLEHPEDKTTIKIISYCDGGGFWYASHQKGLKSGNYVAWAKAFNQRGLESEDSNKINFTVYPSWYFKVGSFVSVNYLIIIFTLLFFLVLLIILLILFASYKRKNHFFGKK